MPLGQNAIAMAAKTMGKALDSVRTQFGAPAQTAPRRLTPGEQFNRFLALKDQDFDILRSRVGEKGVSDYVDAMHALAGRYL